MAFRFKNPKRSVAKIGEKEFDLNTMEGMRNYLDEVAERLKKLPMGFRLTAFSQTIRGYVLDMFDMEVLEKYVLEGAYFDPFSLNADLVYKKVSHHFEHPLMLLGRFVYDNFSSCRWPTGGVLGAVYDGKFEILSVGSNAPIGEVETGEYFVPEADKTVGIEMEEHGLVKRAKTCPRKKIPECTSGKCYGTCRVGCKQYTHTERAVVLNAGLGRISNIDKAGSETFVVESWPYEGKGDLTLLFFGHWWWCEPCARALVGAGLKNAIFVSPEIFKTWNWQGEPLEV